MIPKAILDTSALLCLYHLRLLEMLRLLYAEVRVPSAVQLEFLNNYGSEETYSERFQFLTDFYETHDTWFWVCNEYGTDLVSIYLSEPSIHAGEAEALAQNQFFESTYDVIMDEKAGRRLAEQRGMRKRGTLALLAQMELRFAACNYADCVEQLRRELSTRFSDKVVRAVYAEVKREVEAGRL